MERKPMQSVTQLLLNSPEPSIRYKFLANVLGRDPDSQEVAKIRREIRTSPRTRRLLSEVNCSGEIPWHPYKKWNGAHWTLATLADIGYPPGDKSLKPLCDQVLAWLLSKDHEKHIRTIDGRVRRCASQESNALYALLALGLADSRAAELAYRLTKWQWPDGGWNCDKNPKAANSSYHESLIPFRALNLYAKATGSKEAKGAVSRAAELFLKRELFKRLSNGRIMNADFVLLHYPCYWHYDTLACLKALAEAGIIRDKRCKAALDLLESKRLDDGGFPAEKKCYRTTKPKISGYSLVDWGGMSKRRMNEWVTMDALYVLRMAGRL
jgi:hypothetical protein